MKLNTCLHIMYLVLVIGAMVFMAYGRMALGWSIWFIGFLLWAVLFSVEIKEVENSNKNNI